MAVTLSSNYHKRMKPNIYPLKGAYGRIGYGCTNEKRKAYRNIRRLGFDISETWNLDITIASWLSDNIGGYFRECGSPDTWYDEDLEGNPINYNNEESVNRCFKASIDRRKAFLYHLEVYLKSENIDDFISFVLPRLKFFAKHIDGHPAEITFREWKFVLNDMIECFENKTYSNYFIKYFYYLWC